MGDPRWAEMLRERGVKHHITLANPEELMVEGESQVIELSCDGGPWAWSAQDLDHHIDGETPDVEAALTAAVAAARRLAARVVLAARKEHAKWGGTDG